MKIMLQVCSGGNDTASILPIIRWSCVPFSGKKVGGTCS